MMTLFQLNKQS